MREDADGRSFVQFGDGETGARLPSGVENVKRDLSYRHRRARADQTRRHADGEPSGRRDSTR